VVALSASGKALATNSLDEASLPCLSKRQTRVMLACQSFEMFYYLIPAGFYIPLHQSKGGQLDISRDSACRRMINCQ
jgi:hypothetical protein